MADPGPAQIKFREMIHRLSKSFTQANCKSVNYLNFLSPMGECAATLEDTFTQALNILSSMEANGKISPWNVDKLESILREINRCDLLPIVAEYKESKEYKEEKKKREKEEKKKREEEKKKKEKEEKKKKEKKKAVEANGGDARVSKKKKLRGLYALLNTQITGQSQLMKIIGEELDQLDEGEEGEKSRRVEQQFVAFAEDGDRLMRNLQCVLQEMGIQTDRSSSSEYTSSEDSSVDTSTAETSSKFPSEVSAIPIPAAKQQSSADVGSLAHLMTPRPVCQLTKRTASLKTRKRPILLSRQKKTRRGISEPPKDLDDSDANLGPIPQEEGSTISINDSVWKTSQVKPWPHSDEEDTTGNTGDSGIAEEWRVHSMGNLLDTVDKDEPIYSSLQPRTSYDFKSYSEGNLNAEEHVYTSLMQQRKEDNIYSTPIKSVPVYSFPKLREHGVLYLRENSTHQLEFNCHPSVEQHVLSREKGSVQETRIFVEGSSVHFRNVKRSDAGKYTLSSTNVVGQGQGSFHLKVKFPPTYSLDIDYLQAPVGSNPTVGFTVTSFPPLQNTKHTLKKEGKAAMTKRLKVEGNHIIFRNINLSDSGLYTISCCNDEGQVGEETLELEVLPYQALKASLLTVVKDEDIPFLMEHLSEYSYKWKEIGLALKFSDGETRTIKSNHPFDVEQCFTTLLHKWSQWPTKRHPEEPTMERLRDALCSACVGLGKVSGEVYDLKSKLPSQLHRRRKWGGQGGCTHPKF